MPDYKVTFTEEVTYQYIITDFTPDPDYDEYEEVSYEFFENRHYNDANIIKTESSDFEIEKITT